MTKDIPKEGIRGCQMSFQKEENEFILGFIQKGTKMTDDCDSDEDIEQSCVLMFTVVILIS